MTSAAFIEAVSSLAFPSVFNPYSDKCPHFDLPDGPERRRQNLTVQLQCALDTGVDAIWIGRDLGYRGGRRTGIALTDEPNLSSASAYLGYAGGLTRATKGPPQNERTATVIWRTIRRLELSVFTWNVFPLHPHERGNSLSNRCHTRAERVAVQGLLLDLLNLLRPKHIVAIGNDAEAGLKDLGLECFKVRHPSYGGISDFEKGIYALHGGVEDAQADRAFLTLF